LKKQGFFSSMTLHAYIHKSMNKKVT